MRWSNFEKESKEKLNQRKIKPSERAWKAISEQLVEVKEPKKHKVIWYAVAASLVGILILSFWFYTTSEKPVITPNELVDKPEKPLNIRNSQEVEVVQDQSKLEETTNSNPQPVVEKKVEKANLPDPINDPPNEGAQLVTSESLDGERDNLGQRETALIETKLEEIMAQVNLLEQEKDEVTDLEIDSLLRRAQREILADKIFREDNSVDAMALLNEVEVELDQTFRDQIFEKLKEGFIRVRTAVADRNN